MKIQDFVKEDITVINDMRETRHTSDNSIVFPNGYVGSIVKRDDRCSVAVCDWNGYFNWDILKPFGEKDGTVICQNEDEVCNVLQIIKSIKSRCVF